MVVLLVVLAVVLVVRQVVLVLVLVVRQVVLVLLVLERLQPVVSPLAWSRRVPRHWLLRVQFHRIRQHPSQRPLQLPARTDVFLNVTKAPSQRGFFIAFVFCISFCWQSDILFYC